MHHGRGPPPNRGMHEGDGREPPHHRGGGGGHYDREILERGHHHGDPRHRGHHHHQSHRGDADQRHRDHESSWRDHEGSSRGHDSRHYEGRSHGGHEGRSHSGHEERLHSQEVHGRPQSNERRSHSHESRSHGGHDQEREDINRHHHQNNSGLHRRPSHERHNGRSSSHNGPPQDHRHRNGPDQQRPPPLPPPPAANSGSSQHLPYIAYKLIVDPFLHRDQNEKLTRYDGITPGEERPMEIEPKDPRRKKTSTIIIGKESLDLPMPRFLVDEHYVGEVPNVEVTFENLNDNIDKQFLQKTITKYAEIEEVTIMYHPNTNKHLGLAKAVFKSSKGSRQCVANLHQKTIMGQSINCYLDPGGKGCAKIFEDLTTVRKPSPPPPPPLQEEEEEQVEPRWEDNQRGWDERGDSTWGGGNSRSGHSWQGGDRGHPDDWRQRGGEVGGADWDRNHIQPHWDDEDAQDGWADQPYSRQAPPTRRWGGNDPRRGRERERRGKGEWRRSQEEPEEKSRWSEEHSRFQDNSSHGYPGESEVHASLPPPVPAAAPIIEAEPEVVPPEPTEEDSRDVDLDTRLAMLMQKGKSNMPAFLVGSESSADEAPAPEPEKPAPPPAPVNTGPLSRTPSPFASRDHYLASIQLTIEDELKSVNESLANLQPPGADQFRPPPFTGGHFAGAPIGHFPGQFPGTIPGYWGAGGHIPGAGGAISGHPMTDFPGGPDWDQSDYQNPYCDNQGYYYDYGQGEYYHDIEGHNHETGEGTKKSGKDLINTLKENVLKIVQDELKAILKKDINKKLCESYAYLLFDKWWSEQEANHKARQELEFRKKAETSSNTTMLLLPDRVKVEALNIPRIPKPEDVTNLIEKQRESGTSSFGFGGSLGLGFRGSIPKMAKKIEKKIPKENKAPGSDKVDKDDAKKHKDGGKDREGEKDIITSKDKDKKKSSKPSGNTVYNSIYSDSDESEKKEETESSEVEEEESDSSSDSSSDSDSSDDSSSSDDDDESKDSDAASDKSRDSSPASAKSRSISPLSKDKPQRLKSKSKSPLSIRSKSRSRSKSKSLSRSKSRSKSKSRSTSPILAKSDSDDKKSSPGDRRRRKLSQSSLPDTPKLTTSLTPLTVDDDVVVAAKTPLDRRRKSQLDSGSVSSSPALSRPPTPDIQVKTSLGQKDIVTLPALVDNADNSDTETGSEIEIIEEVKSPRKSAYGKLKEDTQSASSTPGKEDATSAAEALVALSAAAAGSSNAVTPTPVKVQNVAHSPPHIMDHCYARPAPQPAAPSKQKSTSQGAAIAAASPVAVAPVTAKPASRGFDHDYTKPRTPPRAAEIIKERPLAAAVVKERVAATKKSSLPSAPVKFRKRDNAERFHILYKFLTDGIDSEDVMYIKRSYEMMLNESMNQPKMAWINDTHWVDHPVTLVPDPPKKKRRVDDFSRPHKSGCARTEGFYKLHPREKMRTKYHFHRPGVDAFNTGKLGDANQQKPQKAINVSREARSQQRRMLTALGDEFNESELLKFNQLKFRRKAMMFGKSAIHDWGLFAMEHIGADEMVIEYVGDVVRPILSDTREKRYEKQGIGSSYLFRIDLDYVVDATKCGNLARFINHSCEPNCYAKVIKIDGQSKIVIYSKQTIALGEEITYDYKFPIEDEKIRCLCAEKNCRKYLN